MVMGAYRAFLKSKPLDVGVYFAPPLLSGADPATRWKLFTPLYGHPAACKEWHMSLRDFPVWYLGGKATTVDKSFGLWKDGDYSYNFGKFLRDKCVWNIGQCVFEIDEDFDADEQRKVIGVAISHVVDLAITGMLLFF